MSKTVHILATIETDPTRFRGERPASPGLPGRTACDQLLSHLAADLARVFPEIERCDLAVAGALYDQTQIVRPGYPVHAALDDLLSPGPAAAAHGRKRLAAAASDDGAMPDPRLQPDRSNPPGLLLSLPLSVGGDPGLVEPLAEAMEHRFLEQGQLSAHAARAVEAQFGIAVNHARFMTLTDLLALLRLQLEHFGFLPLWELLYAALTDAPGPVAAEARQGQCFEWREGAVHGAFQTFDQWAAHDPLSAGDGADESLAAGYAQWMREYRQYLTTLGAHAVPVVQHAASLDGEALESGFYVEPSANEPAPGAAELTEHSCPDLGVVAVSVVHAGRQHNYYPLTPAGLNDLHAAIRSRGLGPAGFSYPGGLLYHPARRCLVPDVTAPGHD